MSELRTISLRWLLRVGVPAVIGVSRVASQGVPQRNSDCAATADRVAHEFSGELDAGQPFEQQVDRFVVRLTPDTASGVSVPIGWTLGIYERFRDSDLSRYTLPFRGPNDRHIFGWHFRNDDNTGPPPGAWNWREFVFSPEVDWRIVVDSDDAEAALAAVAKITAFGRGTLEILDWRLTPPDRGHMPSLLWLKFRGCLTWPR